MFKSLITKFVTWLVSLFVHETVEQIKEAVNKPNTMTDAKVDTKFKDALDANLADRMQRNKSGNNP